MPNKFSGKELFFVFYVRNYLMYVNWVPVTRLWKIHIYRRIALTIYLLQNLSRDSAYKISAI